MLWICQMIWYTVFMYCTCSTHMYTLDLLLAYWRGYAMVSCLYARHMQVIEVRHAPALEPHIPAKLTCQLLTKI